MRAAAVASLPPIIHQIVCGLGHTGQRARFPYARVLRIETFQIAVELWGGLLLRIERHDGGKQLENRTMATGMGHARR